jgi:small subunit ribosomal protein S16
LAVRLRLRRMGRKKRPFYRIIAADQRAPRDGRFIETIGYYNPLTNPHTIEVKKDRALYWLKNGAQPSDTVASLFRQTGVMIEFSLHKQGKDDAYVNAELEKWATTKAQKRAEIEAQHADAQKREQAALAAEARKAAEEAKAEEAKAEEAKAEEAKAEEAKAEEAKAEEAKAEEAKAEEAKAEEAKAEEAKADEAKADEAKADEAKADEAKADEAKADEVKADEVKADEVKADEVKADEVKADEAKAEEAKEKSAAK